MLDYSNELIVAKLCPLNYRKFVSKGWLEECVGRRTPLRRDFVGQSVVRGRIF